MAKSWQAVLQGGKEHSAKAMKATWTAPRVTAISAGSAMQSNFSCVDVLEENRQKRNDVNVAQGSLY